MVWVVSHLAGHAREDGPDSFGVVYKIPLMTTGRTVLLRHFGLNPPITL